MARLDCHLSVDPRYNRRGMASVVVFDMGGVLYDFQGDQLIARTSRRARRWRREEVQRKWIPLVHRFETGACSATEFAAQVVTAYDLELDGAAFLSAFRQAAVGFYDGALSLVREIGQRHLVVSLSNTNPVQWPAVLAHLGESDPFHAHFPSHVSGFHKPDRRAFEALIDAQSGEARFYFLDDRTQNISAAVELGWHARRVRGVSEARRACVELGLLG
jgi:FMN phosphatase YigB (HAD superfamily)